MESIVNERSDHGTQWEQDDEEVVANGCCLNFSVENSEKTICEEFNSCIPRFKEIYDKAITLLQARARENSMVMFFDFPEPVRVPCEQYLMYFIQFLRDVGIGVTASIQHEMGKVLFSVTPDSKEVALEKIYEALEMFLSLPRMLHTGTGLHGQMDISQQQLIANVQFLQSQLMLAKATVQAQDYTIRNQQNIIDQQSKINESVMQESLRYIAQGKKVEDKETFLGGMFSLKKTEVRGIEIDSPRLYRWIKEKLGGK